MLSMIHIPPVWNNQRIQRRYWQAQWMVMQILLQILIECQCHLPLNQECGAQSGQYQYLFQRVFFPQGALCCRGVFVEFGARNGITHSNSYVYENNLGWKGLLFEVDAKEHQELVHNRPNSDVVLGPVCPSHMDNVTIVLSNIPGFTGTIDTYGT
jgi:hypothetical protein